MKDKNWITQDWAKGAILCAILGILFTMGYDNFKSKPLLSTIWQVVKGVWNFIISALNFNLKVWWLIVGIIIIIAIIYLVTKFRQGEKETVRPDFWNYREGKFKRWRWTWDYKLNYSGKAWNISDLTAHCPNPNCDTSLIDYSSNIHGLRFDCPRCTFRASDDQCDEPYKIEMVIRDNIKRKIYPN